MMNEKLAQAYSHLNNVEVKGKANLAALMTAMLLIEGVIEEEQKKQGVSDDGNVHNG